MNLLVAYDVNTQTAAGAKRLRRVAKICEGYGQRVQDSVFECSVTLSQLEQFRNRLLKVIDVQADSLRIYRLSSEREEVVEVHGRDLYRDMSDPMIV